MGTGTIFLSTHEHVHEIDCLIEREELLIPIEIKSAKTISSNFFSGLNYWNGLSGGSNENTYLVYGGETNQKRSPAQVVSWKNIDSLEV